MDLGAKAAVSKYFTEWLFRKISQNSQENIYEGPNFSKAAGLM